MANVLLFNFQTSDKLPRLRFILFKLGIRAREVEPSDFGESLGFLAGLEGYSAAETPEAGTFSDEMLIMNGFNNTQLDFFLKMLRQEKVFIPCKAVMTEHNAVWSAVHLHHELFLEMEAMKAARRNSVHTPS